MNKASCKEVWFVLHGQGQLAKYFLEKFKPLANYQRMIIAPEGLARYYLNGFSGRVGASWMTKEGRLTDISNYLNFLTAIYEQVIHNPGNCKITVLGFSQGAATASRWILGNQLKFDKLILWAGLFPPDLDFKKGQEKLNNLEVHNVYGVKDEFLTDERIQEQFHLADKLGVALKTTTFSGGHEIHLETLKKLV